MTMTLEQARDRLRTEIDPDALWGSAQMLADAIDAHLAGMGEPYCYTCEQKNGLSQGAMCRTIAECQANPLFDPEIDHVIPLYTAPPIDIADNDRPFSPDWAGYRQGVLDGKSEAIDIAAVREVIAELREMGNAWLCRTAGKLAAALPGGV